MRSFVADESDAHGEEQEQQPAQEELLRQLATARGEERPQGRVANPAEGSIFGKLRDAFKAR